MSAPTDLYRMFDAAGRLLYVGISYSAPRRMIAHRRRQDWWGLVGRIEIEKHPSREQAALAEVAAIGAERPLFNVVHGTGISGRVRQSRCSNCGRTALGDKCTRCEEITDVLLDVEAARRLLGDWARDHRQPLGARDLCPIFTGERSPHRVAATMPLGPSIASEMDGGVCLRGVDRKSAPPEAVRAAKIADDLGMTVAAVHGYGKRARKWRVNGRVYYVPAEIAERHRRRIERAAASSNPSAAA